VLHLGWPARHPQQGTLPPAIPSGLTSSPAAIPARPSRPAWT
jgi:hypothetical protein